jgi:phosphoglycolate phosphatase
VAVAAGPLLLLFDIDGTLLQKASVEHGAALRAAAEAVHGVTLDGTVDYAGRTDAAIVRDLLRLAGVPGEVVTERWAQVQAAAVDEYERRAPADLSDKVAPGIPALLEELAGAPETYTLALVTGNLERIAHSKLRRAGIGHHFQPGQGGFGSDHEDRGELPRIARERASDPAWPRERTVVIGDTPHDIACARVDRVRVAAVATGPYGATDLAGADAVADDARALAPVLRDWA